MAVQPSGGAQSLSLHHGACSEVISEVTVEQVLVAVGELVEFVNIILVSRMNKAAGVFVKEVALIDQLTEYTISVSGGFFVLTAGFRN